MINPLVKDLIEYGVLAMMAAIFLKQQDVLFKKVFELQDKTLITLAHLDSTLHNDKIKGKSLLMMLDLKVEGLRWGIQKRIINYIIKNNIKENYDVIIREITLYIDEKKQDFFITMKEITDITVLKIEMKILTEELENAKNIITELLTDLREEGVKDKTLYDTTKRSVETHFEHFENRMRERHNEIFS